MIDLKKIQCLNNNNEIKKFLMKNKIDKPLYLGNYLFHYLIIFNNLNALKYKGHPLGKENDEGLAAIHLAAKIANETGNFKILEYLLENHQEYIYNENHFGYNFFNYLSVSDKILDLMKKNKKLDWLRLIIHNAPNESKFIAKICDEGSFKLIKYIFDNYILDIVDDFKKSKNFELNKYNNFFTRIIANIKIKNIDLIYIFDKIDNDVLNKINWGGGNSIIVFAIKFRNLEFIKYFVEKKNQDLLNYDAVNTIHPFIVSYLLFKEDSSSKNAKDLLKYIWNKIKKNIDWNETDFNRENIAFRMLGIKMQYNEMNKSPTKLEFDVLKSNKNINGVNVEKFPILSLLIHFDFKKYYKILKGKKIDFTIKNQNGNDIIKEAEFNGNQGWYEYFIKLKKQQDKNVKPECENKIKLNNYKFSDHNVFQSDFLPLTIGFIHLDEKNKKLYLPKNIKMAYNVPSLSKLFSSVIGEKIEIYNNFPFLILWQDENNYFIHPMLNILIKNAYNENKYDFATVFLSIDHRINDSEGSLHANLLIYNFKTKTIEYFEPNGSGYVNDSIHNVLKEELCWNTGFKYLEPKDYSPVASFQYLAMENNKYELKPGDFGGYCMAWCFWYLEHRLINPDVHPKILVQKLIDNILLGKFNLVEYIRNYANKFYLNVKKILKKIGVKETKITNLYHKKSEVDAVWDFIVKKTSIDH